MYLHAKTHIQMSITGLFIVTKSWKQTKCSIAGKWINKFWYCHTIEYYSVIKNIKLLICRMVSLKSFVLSKSQRLPTIWFHVSALNLFNITKIVTQHRGTFQIARFLCAFSFWLNS